MLKNSFTKQLPVLSLTLVIAACSSTGPAPTGAASTQTPDGKSIFSDVAELDFNPPKEDYRIGANDLIDIKVFQAPELSQSSRVDPQGNISLPLVGTIKAAGLTPSSLEQNIAKLLSAKYLQDPQVTVFMKEFTTQRVTVEGEVQKSGVFPIQGEMTLLQAVALAGGMNPLADPSKTVLFRKQGNALKAYNINLNFVRDGKMRDPYIRNDDRIIVHRSDTRFWLRETGSLLNPLRVLIP